jgi:hypothetical protein
MKRLTLAKGLAGMDGKELLCAMSFNKEDTLQQILTTALFMALSDADQKKFEFTISLDLKPITQKQWDEEKQISDNQEAINEYFN